MGRDECGRDHRFHVGSFVFTAVWIPSISGPVLLNWKAFTLWPSFASMVQAIAPQCFGELYLSQVIRSNPTCSRS